MPSIAELLRSSSLVFSGVVIAIGASSVSTVPPDPTLITVRVSRVFHSDPALGDLRGRVITVKSATAGELRPEQSALFFTRGWVHGGSVAVIEVARMDAGAEDETAAAVQALPDAHLQDRIAAADRVVVGQVIAVNPISNQRPSRHSPNWEAASIDVDRAIKGSSADVTILFPTATTVEWYRAPRLAQGQRGVFIIRRNDPLAAPWIDESAMGVPALTALDPADVQPELEVSRIQSLMESGGGQP
jgi:hypothetical protein